MKVIYYSELGNMIKSSRYAKEFMRKILKAIKDGDSDLYSSYVQINDEIFKIKGGK